MGMAKNNNVDVFPFKTIPGSLLGCFAYAVAVDDADFQIAECEHFFRPKRSTMSQGSTFPATPSVSA